MGTLFISHSSKDNARAVFVRDWLRDAGWADVFLDLDPVAGLAPGQRWQEELRKAGERCAAVVVLVSPNWLASDWCRTEFLLAAQLGKLIFPVIISPVPFDALPLELKAHYQMVDLSDPATEAEGLERFRIGLQRAGLHPEDFPWPPPGDPMRSPYRGLGALEQCDAAVFFGREAAITKGLDAIRQMADGTPERVLVILGASGSGKSSFLQAGLLARLARDTSRFCVLPTMRPGRAAMHGPKGLLASLGLSSVGGREALRTRLAEIRQAVRSGPHADEARPLTLVMPIDQAEELLDGSGESAAAMAGLNDLLAIDPHVLVVLTLRTDRFADLQLDGALGALPRRTFDLPPLPAGAYKQIVEAPGALADPPIEIEPALTERLLNDLGARDALPLLAFTLDWMLKLGGRQLTLEDYERELGGVAGAIERAVGAALSEAVRDPALPDSHGELELLIRYLFLPWLVQVDEAGGLPQRRVAMVDELPVSTRPLMTPLVAHRLLITRDDGGRATVEVAHEAVLRHWPALARWIEEDRGRLAALRAVQRAAQDWSRCAPDEDASQWLVHRGDRLTDAEQLRSDRNLGALLDETDHAYLSVCRAAEDRRAAEQAEHAARERAHLSRQRQQQRRISIALGLIGVLLAAMGFLAVTQLRSASEQVSLVLADYSRRALEEGDTARAMRLGLLAAREDWLSSPAPTARPSLAAAAQASHLILDFVGHSAGVRNAVFSQDESRMATVDDAGEVRLWDLENGRALGVVTHGGRNPLETGARFSLDGTRLVSWGHDGSLVIRDARDGRVLARQKRPSSIWETLVSEDRIMTRESGALTLWRLSDGAEVAHWTLKGGGGVQLFDDGTRLLVWDAAGALSVCRTEDGRPLLEIHYPQRIEDARILNGDDELIVFGGAGQSSLIRASDGAFRATLKTPFKDSFTVSLSKDGRRVAVTRYDAKELYLWRRDEPARWTVAHSPTNIARVVWSHAGNSIATWAYGEEINLWQADSGQLIGRQTHDRGVLGVAFSKDDSQLLSWGREGVAKTWDALTSKEIERFQHNDAVIHARFSRDGSRVISWDSSGVVDISGARHLTEKADVRDQWRASEKRTVVGLVGARGTLLRHGQGTYVAGLHELAKTQRLISWGRWGRVQMWHGQSRVASKPLPPDHRIIRIVSGADQFLVATPDQGVQAWDRNTWRAVTTPHPGLRVFDAVAEAGGVRVLALNGEDEFILWTTADDALSVPRSLPYEKPHRILKARLTQRGPQFLAERLEVEPYRFSYMDLLGHAISHTALDTPSPLWVAGGSVDGRRALIATRAGETKMFDLDSGAVLFERRPTGSPPLNIEMLADGRFVVISDSSDTVVWSVLEGHAATSWKTGKGRAADAVFLAETDRVVIIYSGGRGEVRDMSNGALISVFEAEHTFEHAIQSPSGQQIVAWSEDYYENVIGVWDVESGRLLAKAPSVHHMTGAITLQDGDGVFVVDPGEQYFIDFSFAFASHDAGLAHRVCETQLHGTDGPSPAIRKISSADIEFAPILAGREGEDVCH